MVLTDIFIKTLHKVSYGFGFGMGMALAFTIIPRKTLIINNNNKPDENKSYNKNKKNCGLYKSLSSDDTF